MTLADLAGFLSDPKSREDMLRRAQAMSQSGARGFTTGLLGGPVDLANMAMGGAGGDKPVMGSEWIGDKLSGMGLLSGKPEGAGQSLAELGGGLLNPGGALKAAAVKGPALAALLFHGSPHKFDKFDMSKIGTGEGAQAYGHGLYFAENPGVAKNYREMLTKEEQTRAAKNPQNVASMHLEAPHIGGDRQKAIEQLKFHRSYVNAKETDEAIALLESGAPVSRVAPNAGALYKVDVPDEAIGKMLDWDKPLSKQPKSVQASVKKLWQEQRIYGDPSKLTGEGIHGSLVAHYVGDMTKGSAKDAATKDMRHYGIPGIRYLDQGSRAKGGTSNYVLFDDQLPKIVGVE
jgi:hypothetical protein